MAVVLYFSISLDGCVAGPGISNDNAMGVGGEALHDWMFDNIQPADQTFSDRMRANPGAVVIGRRTFDVGLQHWGDVPYPAPSFVVTHRARDPLPQQSGTFTFVTTGIADAVRQAKAAAGDREVIVMGAETARQVLALGLVDRLELQLVPILLPGGAKLFEDLARASLVVTQREPATTTSVTHLSYEVRKA